MEHIDSHRSDALVEEGRVLVANADEHGLTMRLLGGVGVFLHCPRTLGHHAHRTFKDLDVAVPPGSTSQTTSVMTGAGYEADRRFNAMQDDRRMIFYGPNGKVDVFVGDFAMCHRLALTDRLALDPMTLTATDLLLTKLQVVEFNQKDLDDSAALLAEHEFGEGDDDHIDKAYLARLLGDDWGLWRTVSGSLATIAERLPQLAGRTEALMQVAAEAPKSRRFRMRARIGERKLWYEQPDEIA
jgi:hypothetical protein